MKTEKEAKEYLLKFIEDEHTKTEMAFLRGEIQFCDLALQAFTRFFQSYTTSFNKVFERKGNLFYSSFKRVLVEDDLQFQRTLMYIHTNPVKHGIITDFKDWKWSSWHDYTGNKAHSDLRKEVYGIFGGKQAFINAHELHQSYILENIHF